MTSTPGRCDECVLLGPAGRSLGPDELQRRAQRCGDCPHLAAADQGTRALTDRLLGALAQANRAARQATSKLHQRERECAELAAAIAGTEQRMAQIENIQIAGVAAADRELAARLQQIEHQHREIATLSTPCIQVWDGVLVVPLIGAFDELRAQVLRDTVLAAIPRVHTRSVIFDLTGVADIDRATVEHLFRIIAAIRLLGASPVMVGLCPQVARKIVALDLQSPTFTILRDLREAVALAVRGG